MHFMAIKIGKPSASTYKDALIIAGIKTVEERLLAPIIGNGTLKSGIIKAVVGFVLPSIGGSNKWTNLAGTAFIVDSTEDLVNAGLQMMGWGGAGANSGVVI